MTGRVGQLSGGREREVLEPLTSRSTEAALHDALMVPGRNPGKVFIPALGKTFQQSEIFTVAYEFSEAAYKRWLGNEQQSSRGQYPLILNRYPENGAFTARLQSGVEMAVTKFFLQGLAQSDEDELQVLVNRKEIICLSPALLRAHSVRHIAEEVFTPLRVLAKGDSSIEDLLIGLQGAIQNLHTVVLGVHLHVPAQLRDNDDIRVLGLPKGNALFMMGILCVSVGG